MCTHNNDASCTVRGAHVNWPMRFRAQPVVEEGGSCPKVNKADSATLMTLAVQPDHSFSKFIVSASNEGLRVARNGYPVLFNRYFGPLTFNTSITHCITRGNYTNTGTAFWALMLYRIGTHR